jgi:aldehyde dehydrogenase (NAD+)
MTAVTAAVVKRLQAPMFDLHESGVNRNYDWRVEQLKKVGHMLTTHSSEFQDALALDLGKEMTEACCTEIFMVQSEISYALANLKTWMQPQPVPTPLFLAPCISEIQRVPLRAPGMNMYFFLAARSQVTSTIEL